MGFLAFVVWAFISLMWVMAWYTAAGLGLVDPTAGPVAPLAAFSLYEAIRLAFYALFAVLIGWHCRRNFDSLAGRLAVRRPPLAPVAFPSKAAAVPLVSDPPRAT
jgi:hypothetical protein